MQTYFIIFMYSWKKCYVLYFTNKDVYGGHYVVLQTWEKWYQLMMKFKTVKILWWQCLIHVIWQKARTGIQLYLKLVYYIVQWAQIFLFQVVTNLLIPDHDAGVFNPPSNGTTCTATYLDRTINVLLGGLRRWDAIYFTHIAQYGYTYENTLAFFPLFPVSVRIIASFVFYPLSFVVSYQNLILISSLFLNILLFVKSAEILFWLGRYVLKNDLIAYKASLLFCINPASIFFSAPYSECLYFYLTLNALLHLEKKHMLTSMLFVSLSFLARSNGALNICYFLYVVLRENIPRIQSLRRAAFVNIQTFVTAFWIFFVFTIIPCSALLVISITPFILYQIYCYKTYCVSEYSIDVPEILITYGKENYLKVQGFGAPSAWCNDAIPLAYRCVFLKHVY